MYKTCRDIENSLYIAPNEIRSCCQRFFHKGKIRGDAKLIKIKEGKTPTIKIQLRQEKKYQMKFRMIKMKIVGDVLL